MDLTIHKPLAASGAEQQQSCLTHSHGCNCQKKKVKKPYQENTL